MKCTKCGQTLPQSSDRVPKRDGKARTKALNVEKVDTKEDAGDPESEVPKGKRDK